MVDCLLHITHDCVVLQAAYLYSEAVIKNNLPICIQKESNIPDQFLFILLDTQIPIKVDMETQKIVNIL